MFILKEGGVLNNKLVSACEKTPSASLFLAFKTVICEMQTPILKAIKMPSILYQI